MALQGKLLSFSIPSGTPATLQGTVNFSSEEIVNNQVFLALGSIDVSYDGGGSDHDRGMNQFIPSVVSIEGSQVVVNLQFNYSDDSKNYMSGTVTVLVLADVD